jgi:hypothetical protein
MVGLIIGVLKRVGASRPAGHPMWLTMLLGIAAAIVWTLIATP